MTQLLKIILKLVFEVLLWIKSFFSQNNPINSKRMRAASLKSETRAVSPQRENARLALKVFSRPLHFEDDKQGQTGHQIFLQREAGHSL